MMLFLWGCASSPALDDDLQIQTAPLVLTFAGDIMAHDVNFNMRDYGMIYRDIRKILHSDDLTFANFETPVADALPMSTYPRFNVHQTYLDAAVAGGFNVFSLANNHTNDHGRPGMEGTLEAVHKLPKGIVANGIRETDAHPLVPVVIKKKGWTIVFLAVTEILNSHDASLLRVQYSPPTSAGRKALNARIEQIATDHPESLFILSLHTNEPEYVRTVSETKKRWFMELAKSGADIVWAHHPHVMQPWELVSVDGRDCLFMYSMGNFISGQRYRPDLENPGADREYTGDAVLLQVRIHTDSETGTMHSPEIIPLPVTNYRDPGHGMVVRRLSPGFIKSLPASLATYYRKRTALMNAYLPVLPSTTQPSILE